MMMQRGFHITALLCALALLPMAGFAQTSGSGDAIAHVRELLKTRDYDSVRDTIMHIAIIDILDKTPWTETELYVLGTQLLDKEPDNFMGRYLRGWYLSKTATDKLGYRKALDELRPALEDWDLERHAPYRGNLDALLSAQALANVPDRERVAAYLGTYYYLQLAYECSSVYLELDMPAESYSVMKQIRDAGFASDFYSLTRMSWIFYKYRDLGEDGRMAFLHRSGSENIEESIRLAKQQQRDIVGYIGQKSLYPRYWVDNSSIEWYTNAADNVISIAYGVGWQSDSAITYYERMPEWFKLRLNGTYLYLADINYRAAERQFEYIGKAGTQPIAVLQEPEALESYKNILIYRNALNEAHFYLDDYPGRYQRWRGMGLLWEGTADYWSGDLDEAESALKRAYAYPEAFGNTSFTRLHYDMQIHIQLSAVHNAKRHRLEFEPILDRAWYEKLWYAVNNFFLRVYHWLMASLHEYWAVDAYLQIVDRDEYIKVFYTENPADYFQTWAIIRNLNPAWHIAQLKEARAGDARLRAKKFYDLFTAGFLREQGRKNEALDLLRTSRLASQADTTYEKLFYAMTEDLTARLVPNDEDRQRHVLNIYRHYPQAVFLWGHTLPLAVRYEQPATALAEPYQDYYSEMRDIFEQFGFEFVPEQKGVPTLIVSPEEGDEGVAFRYAVAFDGGVRSSGTIAAHLEDPAAQPDMTPGKAARELAYSVFTIRLQTEENSNAHTIARGR